MTTIDDVYAQRNELAIAFAKAALAAGWKAGKGIDPMADPEWANVVYVDLPDGRQVSWHISPDSTPLLDGLPQYTGEWDGTFVGRAKGWSKQVEAKASVVPREVAQQALEALKYIDTEFRKHGRQHWPEAVRARAAIKAVEEALRGIPEQ